jgi:hypothetical protein
MAQGYQLIQTVNVGSGGAASIEFTSIPQNYTDLVIKLSLRSTVGAAHLGDAQMIFNGSTAANYSFQFLRGSSSAINIATSTGQAFIRVTNNHPTVNNTESTFCNSEIYIPNYTSSNAKTTSEDNVSENNTTEAYIQIVNGAWSLTSAISSIKITSGATAFAQYSTATLYGIGGTRATGGTITADGNYTYHTFTSTGSFIPSEKIRNAEILTIAGGGSGGSLRGGGGGAGGLLYSPGQLLTAGTSYTAVVGAGGALVTSASGRPRGNNGSNSMFSSNNAIGGGGGGVLVINSDFVGSGLSGGSGGGAGGVAGTGTGAVGTGTAGQGNNGGLGFSGGETYSGGGGGGAGAVGEAGVSLIGGIGGIGSSAFTSWALATNTGVDGYYAGGGGGGDYYNPESPGAPGGFGGGGNGGRRSSSSTFYNGGAGTANTGGGGGGLGQPDSGTASSGAGGSGLVIIRYPNN